MTNQELQKLEADVKESKAVLLVRWNSFKNEISQTLTETKKSISIHHQIEVHPWSMFGAAIVTGMALSRACSVKQFVALDKESIKKNVRYSLTAVIEQLITHTTDRLLTPQTTIAKSSRTGKREINEKGESIAS
jgi:hypothetical protein